MTRSELCKLAEQAQHEADEAMVEASAAFQALIEAQQTRKVAYTRAADLLKHATRLRIQYMRAQGAAVEKEEAGE